MSFVTVLTSGGRNFNSNGATPARLRCIMSDVESKTHAEGEPTKADCTYTTSGDATNTAENPSVSNTKGIDEETQETAQPPSNKNDSDRNKNHKLQKLTTSEWLTELSGKNNRCG